MKLAPKVWRQSYIEAMIAVFEDTMGKVTDGIIGAARAYLINGNEEEVRDVLANLRQ
jgi:hypothetical protein